MPIPTTDFITNFLTILFAIVGATAAAFWLGSIIWAFRDMRLRSRDPFAQILAAILVGVLPFVGTVLYLVLRPPETLADRYLRSLEEEALLQEMESRPSCAKCKRRVNEDWMVCPSCVNTLKKPCGSCNNLLDLKWKSCPYCAEPQQVKKSRFKSQSQPQQSQQPVQPQPQQRPVESTPVQQPNDSHPEFAPEI